MPFYFRKECPLNSGYLMTPEKAGRKPGMGKGKIRASLRYQRQSRRDPASCRSSRGNGFFSDR
ncbi:hypothetical protein F7F42_24145 [Escherichia coli]|nr:hypothetical protein F7F42_24145 [Escherichia coli]